MAPVLLGLYRELVPAEVSAPRCSVLTPGCPCARGPISPWTCESLSAAGSKHSPCFQLHHHHHPVPWLRGWCSGQAGQGGQRGCGGLQQPQCVVSVGPVEPPSGSVVSTDVPIPSISEMLLSFSCSGFCK